MSEYRTLFKMKYTFVYSLLWYWRATAVEQGCSLLLDENSPKTALVFRTDNSHDFLYPQKRNVISLSENETIRVTCLNEYFQVATNDHDLKVKCLRDGEVDVKYTKWMMFSGEKKLNFSELECRQYPKSMIKRTSRTCYGNHSELIEIGYQVDECFINLLSVCYDKYNENTLYTTYRMSMLHFGRQQRYNGTGMMDDMDLKVDEIYDWKYQKGLFNKIMKSEGSAARYIRPDGLHVLVNTLLTSDEEFVYGSQQQAVRRVINSAPMWASVRKGNWKMLEIMVQDVLAHGEKKFAVATGTHGVLTLPDDNNEENEIYLRIDNAKKRLPVAKLFWKMVYCLNDRFGVVAVTDIEVDYNQFKAHNESKNIFKAARTPAVIVAIIIIFYVVSGIFGLVGLYALANIANLIMGIAILTLATWAYIRYSGEIRDIGEIIDHAATMVWETIMKPVYQIFVEKSLEHAAKEATKIMIRQNSQLNGKVGS